MPQTYVAALLIGNPEGRSYLRQDRVRVIKACDSCGTGEACRWSIRSDDSDRLGGEKAGYARLKTHQRVSSSPLRTRTSCLDHIELVWEYKLLHCRPLPTSSTEISALRRLRSSERECSTPSRSFLPVTGFLRESLQRWERGKAIVKETIYGVQLRNRKGGICLRLRSTSGDSQTDFEETISNIV